MLAGLISALLTSASFAQRALPSPQSSGWHLHQRHIDAGEVDVFMTKDAVKMVLKNLGLNLLCRAPGTTVYIFRPDEKTFWTGSIERLEAKSLINPFSPPAPTRLRPVTVVAFGKAGVNARRRQIVQLISSGKQGNLSYNEYSARARTGTRSVFRATSEIAAPPFITSILSRMYEVPDTGLVPVYARTNMHHQAYAAELEKSKEIFEPRVETRDVRIGPVVKLETESAQKCLLDDGVFALPSGYTAKRDILDVTYSRKQKNEMSDLLNDIGFATKTGESSSQTADKRSAKESTSK